MKSHYIAAMIMGAASLSAAAAQYLNIRYADGTYESYVVTDDLAVRVSGSKLTVSGSGSEAAIEIDDVRAYTYSATPAGVESATVAPSVMPDASGFTVELPVGEHSCRVYSTGGVEVAVYSFATTVHVDLGTQPRGVYVVAIDTLKPFKYYLR